MAIGFCLSFSLASVSCLPIYFIHLHDKLVACKLVANDLCIVSHLALDLIGLI
jgi:hypothetical protein